MQTMKPSTLHETPSSIKSNRTFLEKFNNAIKRVTFGALMISTFTLIILKGGPIMLVFVVLTIQVLCFREVLHIGYNSNKVPPSLPYFRSLSWYFLVAANYFCSIETLAPHFQDYQKFYYFTVMVKYHRFISFCIYFIGIVVFVLSLVRKHDLKQFRILAWTHTLLIVVVLQSYMIIENMFRGLIWFILPVSLVILNDIFAYVFGRLWGKTPLIELSPKKTWEGFIGGVIGTVISGFLLSNLMSQYKYFVCPIEYYDTGGGLKMATDCTPSYLFIPTSSIGFFNFYPFTDHFLALALFASIIAPFGGFCASGFKRAFKIKDFGDVIPGHGGIMDRFDCQFLMATFVNVYISTFVRTPSVDRIFDKILNLDEGSQVQFYYMLKDSLESVNYLQNLTDIR